jgi:hypothetical protein
MRLVPLESARARAIEKLEEATVVLSKLEGRGSEATGSPGLSQQYSRALIEAYKAANTAEAIDPSTPGIDDTIKAIELIYRSEFQTHITRKDYDIATIYVENMEKSGIYTPSATAMLQEIRVALDEAAKVKSRSFHSF